MNSSLLWNVALAMVWVVLTGRTAPGNFAAGFLIGSLVVYFVRRAGGVPRPYLKVYQSIDLLVFFLWQLVLSNVKIAHDVMTPRHLMRPAIVAVPLDAKTDMEMTLAGVLATVRLVKGPTLSDRVVALDLIAILVVGVVATSTVWFGSPVLFQPTVALAMLAFLGTVAFAHAIERRGPS